MLLKLKKLSEQTIVITGASSGIGLITARMAAKRGARVVLNARNEETLRVLARQINETGGEAIHAGGDVGQFEDVQNIAEKAIRRFGGIDTWVNNAAVSIYGQRSDRPKPSHRRDSLYTPMTDGKERGEYPGHVAESSVYTKASLHPLIAGSLLAGVGWAAWAGWRSLNRGAQKVR